jgi:hypothetical protein
MTILEIRTRNRARSVLSTRKDKFVTRFDELFWFFFYSANKFAGFATVNPPFSSDCFSFTTYKATKRLKSIDSTIELCQPGHTAMGILPQRRSGRIRNPFPQPL